MTGWQPGTYSITCDVAPREIKDLMRSNKCLAANISKMFTDTQGTLLSINEGYILSVIKLISQMSKQPDQ